MIFFNGGSVVNAAVWQSGKGPATGIG